MHNIVNRSAFFVTLLISLFSLGYANSLFAGTAVPQSGGIRGGGQARPQSGGIQGGGQAVGQQGGISGGGVAYGQNGGIQPGGVAYGQSGGIQPGGHAVPQRGGIQGGGGLMMTRDQADQYARENAPRLQKEGKQVVVIQTNGQAPSSREEVIKVLKTRTNDGHGNVPVVYEPNVVIIYIHQPEPPKKKGFFQTWLGDRNDIPHYQGGYTRRNPGTGVLVYERTVYAQGTRIDEYTTRQGPLTVRTTETVVGYEAGITARASVRAPGPDMEKRREKERKWLGPNATKMKKKK